MNANKQKGRKIDILHTDKQKGRKIYKTKEKKVHQTNKQRG